LTSGNNIIYTTSVTTNGTTGLATVTFPAGVFSSIFSIQVTAVGGTTAPNAIQAGVQSVNGTTSAVVQSWNESGTQTACQTVSGGGLSAAQCSATVTLQQPKYVGATVYVTVIGD
jgi:hypothetical protein